MHDLRLTRDKLNALKERLSSKSVIAQLGSWEISECSSGLFVSEQEFKGKRIWGGKDETAVLRTSFQLEHHSKRPLFLDINLGLSKSLEALSFLYGPEAMVYIDGKASHGYNPYHQSIPLDPSLADGNKHEVMLTAWTGIEDGLYSMEQPVIVALDEDAHRFLQYLDIGLQVVDHYEETIVSAEGILDILDGSVRLLEFNEQDELVSAEAALDHMEKAYQKMPDSLPVTFGAVGHAHLDIAWLWTISQAREKAARTFSTALQLMEDNDDFIFSQSQPQLYDFVKHDYPDLYTKIKNRVADGHWEPLGGMWVEADCNITGAESLARQFLYGRQFFEQEFGKKDSPVLWLPDVFGYSWQLPQLMRSAGIEYFVTAKLSWNQINRMPYDTFSWKGLDGSEIMTHLITTKKPGWWGATYSADLEPEELMCTWEDLQQKQVENHILIPYGQGDGGGGPNQRMVDYGKIMDSHPLLPKVEFTKAHDFLKTIEHAHGETLPTWDGELYLELHRGTYTTQAKNKRYNRKSEILLHDLEFIATWASLLDDLYQYPADEIRNLWKKVCLLQFHDIIPGSSIEQVYQESLSEYGMITSKGSELLEEAQRVVASAFDLTDKRCLFNTTSFDREILNGTGSVPAYGLAAVVEQNVQSQRDIIACAIDEFQGSVFRDEATWIMENDLVHIEFDESGEMISIFDRECQREILGDSRKANYWMLYEDRPIDWDAWDIEVYHDEKSTHINELTNLSIERHDDAVIIHLERAFGVNTINETVSLRADSKRIDCQVDIHWEARHRLLKVQFDTNIHNSSAIYDIQWGNLERPTHRNTTWDWARFESCGHKWVDYSEGDYGLSLLNDCKYGFSVNEGTIQMSVLRGPEFPDAHADIGDHQFSYAILPHTGDWKTETVREAYDLNYPFLELGGDVCPQPVSPQLVSVDTSQLVIETVKRSEDGKGLILRMYECHRTRGTAELSFGFPVRATWKSDLLENKETELPMNEQSLFISYTPYEIITLYIQPE